MSCLSRRVVENKIKKQQAREEGNTNALFGLVVLGCLLFAGHALFTQMGRFRHSLKDLFRKLPKKDVLTNSGKKVINQLKDEKWQNMADFTTKANDDREQ